MKLLSKVSIAVIGSSLLALAACKPAATPAAAPPAAAPAAASPDDAGEVRVGDLVIRDARTRETAAPGVTGIGFLSIRNAGAIDDALVSARSEVAGSVELHSMSMADGVMQMRALTQGLPIPARATVTLASGGAHLMIVEPKAAFVAGTEVPVTLRFAKAGEVSVRLKVEPLVTAESPDPHAGH